MRPSSRIDNGEFVTYVFEYEVPAVTKTNNVNLRSYDLRLILNHWDSSNVSGLKIRHIPKTSGQTGQSSAVSFADMMTHASAQAAASDDTLVGGGTLSADNNWQDTTDFQPVTGFNKLTGEKVYYSYYVVEDDSSYETYYQNNEGVGYGNITICNKIPDTNQEYTSLTVKKEWKSSSDPQTDITSSKQGHILFEIRRVLRYSKGGDVPNSDVRYTGGTLENPISGAVERLEDGTYKISSKEDGVDESGKTKYVWHPASIVNLPLHEEASDGSETYTCVYYVHELPGDYQEDTTYQVGSVSGGSCVATNNGATVIIINREMASYALPATGGAGTRRIYLVSIMLIALAGVGLILVRRRREMTR